MVVAPQSHYQFAELVPARHWSRVDTTQLTTNPAAASVPAIPEFVDAKGLRAVFGISRSQGYALAASGKVRTVCLRRRGSSRGKRLWDCFSVRSFLRDNIEACCGSAEVEE
jgi:hypothetical protein